MLKPTQYDLSLHRMPVLHQGFKANSSHSLVPRNDFETLQ